MRSTWRGFIAGLTVSAVLTVAFIWLIDQRAQAAKLSAATQGQYTFWAIITAAGVGALTHHLIDTEKED